MCIYTNTFKYAEKKFIQFSFRIKLIFCIIKLRSFPLYTDASYNIQSQSHALLKLAFNQIIVLKRDSSLSANYGLPVTNTHWCIGNTTHFLGQTVS